MIGPQNTRTTTMRLLSTMMRRCRRFMSEEEGPTAVEYAVMLALILAVCMSTINVLATATRDSFDRSADAILTATY